MLRIKTLTLKNFLSVGAIPQTLNFNTDDLVLVLGENLDLGGVDNRNRCSVRLQSLMVCHMLYMVNLW